MKKSGPYCFVISGGGTGGHIFPAIAIGNALKAKYPDATIEFVGARDKMEMQKVPEAGFVIHGLWISGLQRKLTASNLMFPFKVLHSVIRSFGILNRLKPHVVIGVGGFASGPLMYAASLKKIPTLIQEQNSYPGITNKLLAAKASRICVAFPNMERFFPKDKIVLTGNPIRQDILTCSRTKEEALNHFGLELNKPCILVVGGSLGARTINLAIEAGLAKLEASGVQILWQTGKTYQKEQRVAGLQTMFIKEMDLAYKAADLVVSRAGASSLSEICALGKSAILVPSPNVAEDHQTKNAMSLVASNAAILVRDGEAMEHLIPKALETLGNEALMKTLAANARRMAHTSATEAIVHEIESLITG